MSVNNPFPDYEYPIGPVGVSTPEALGTMPHRILRFPSVHARDAFLTRAMEPLEGPSEDDFTVHEAPASGGKYDMFFRKGGDAAVLRAWTRDPEAQAKLDRFIDDKLS